MELNKEIETKEEIDVSSNSKNKDSKLSIRKKLPRVYLYFLYFIIFAFIGWLIETAFSYYSLGHFTKRGFLYGPLCPIYGWGAIILIIFFSTYRRKNLKLFILAAIIFSFFEYMVGYALDALFSLKLWNYTNEFMNLNGRISIFYSFAWGIIAILVINIIYPFFKKKINLVLSKIPYAIQVTLVYVLFTAFIADTVLSCIRYLFWV